MDVVKPSTSKALVSVAESSQLSEVRRKKKVLEEEDYEECLTKIIERDYFPDLKKLKAQSEYLEAKKNNDVVKMAELVRRYTPRLRDESLSNVGSTPYIYATPVTFDTPRTDIDEQEITPQKKKKIEQKQEQLKEDGLSAVPSIEKLGIDKFLNKFTSEDHESFGEVMEEAEKKRLEKQAWLYVKEGEQLQLENGQSALPSIQEQAALEGNPTKLQTWTYKPANALMYNIDGAALTPEEKIKLSSKRREINIDGTRFLENPFKVPDVPTSTASIINVKYSTGMSQHKGDGKVDHTGNEIGPKTPDVAGYSFESTPDIVPGNPFNYMITPGRTPGPATVRSMIGDESPLMTWGELEGEPFLLDASDEPVTRPPAQGKGFQLKDEPNRDRIGRELAEKLSKQHRDKKSQAVKRMKSQINSPHLTRNERLSNLSPAAQRLASARGVHLSSDRALRSSYTPTRTPNQSEIQTPTYSLSSTPPTIRTPGTPLTPALKTPKRIKSTGNLFKSGKNRPKASDFF